MNNKYFLAIDIGASSGRHILGWIENNKIFIEEIFRFKNGAEHKDGKFVWNKKDLFQNVINGLKKCKEINKIPVSLGIDTWGVDYALLDSNDKIIGDIFSYRDERTLAVIDEVHSIISEDEFYQRTGIQKQIFNTIYQLYSDKKSGKINNAKSFLMVPDYLNFLLTGIKSNEYTEASTSGLINAKTRSWDNEIIERLGFDKTIFQKVCAPGTIIGSFKKEIVDEVGFNCNVCLCPSHDTASAIMSVPNTKLPLYISSGTWSLMGIETQVENTSNIAKKSGFTNEGGYNKSITFLKNIMGLWMIQCIKKEYNDKYSFSDFVDEANKAIGFNSFVDVNDISFFAPKSMINAVQEYCKKTNQKVPESVGEIVLCVYQSLAKCYAEAVDQLEEISGNKYDTINIVGGGSQNDLLNELTAKYTKRTVVAGPVEATAIGNMLSQMLAVNALSSLNEGKELIKKSFDIKEIHG